MKILRKLAKYILNHHEYTMVPGLHLEANISKEDYKLISSNESVTVYLCINVESVEKTVVVGELSPTNLTHQKVLLSALKN